MRFSHSIKIDILKPIRYTNSDSSSFISDTSSDAESSNTTYPSNSYTSLNDTSSYKTNIKTRDTSPSYIRFSHPTDSASLPPHNITSQNRHLESYYKLRQQPRKDYRLFLSPSKILKH